MTQLDFQLYDYQEDHETTEDDDIGEYIIHAFGRCYDGKSVYAKIIGFTPSFYILLPEKLQNKSKQELDQIKDKFLYTIKSNDNKKVYYKYKKSLIEANIVKSKKAEGFTNNKEFWFIRLKFNNYDSMKRYKSYFENNEISFPNIIDLNKPKKYKLYEANLPPMFRCFHIKDISGCSWVQINKYKIIEDKESLCDIEINVDYRDLIPIKKDNNAPFRICSFDIECNSIDGDFPQAKRKGDAIIQIGFTYTYIGQSTPYRQYIVCLNDTSDLDNILVDSCKTEEELLYKFLEEIQNNDCDIITGYNIFFFDEKYIYDRCELLGIKDRMLYLSKLRTFKCKFNETKLSSSAMGENLLRIWNTPGRVHIDLMKDIQKTFNLTCYKLDFVASRYIRDKIISYKILDDTIELTCKGVQDILVQDYIHIEVINGFVSDDIGDKYLILEVNKSENKLIIKSSTVLINDLKNINSGEIFWSQAKDDVSPKDIFRLQKGSPDDRSLLAKYCIKDCKLVNLLINKLEVVTKNIEMANVCYVPLSYLFTRGQGIKLFSLCLREFRKQHCIFPVIKLDKIYKCSKCNIEYKNYWSCPECKSKERHELESADTSYEGAMVFDPVPTVDYEAATTKDFASLYPSAILQKNMSHETIVENPEYDNLPGVKYYNANFKESDGSIQYRRFAQIDNKFGVIPSILDNLMNERKLIKKQMKTTTDPFKLKILDAKQLAVKITANSLYGQLGASTSPVCKRDIAACTTSTGKEMLILAKKYDEELLPYIINSFKYFSETNQQDKYSRLLKEELKSINDIKLLDKLNKYIKTDINNLIFQPVIRYGDSVIGETPLLLKDSNDNIFISRIDKLVNPEYYKTLYREKCVDLKEGLNIYGLYTWTEKGWTPIHRIIRHKLNENKKLFKVITNNGYVIVTEDHSLLNEFGNEVKPNEIKIGDKLLHSFPDLLKHKTKNDADIINQDNILNFDYNIRKEYLDNVIIDNDNMTDKMMIYALSKSVNYDIYFDMNGNIHINDGIKDDRIISIEEYDKTNEEYVYDLTTENHHFHAGVGSIIVHNTDSIFSCYRFRENCVKVDNENALKLWKKIIKFGHDLLIPYFKDSEKEVFSMIFNEYYSQDKIINLEIPEGPKCCALPTYHKIILPINERMKIFIKEYMEESYLPWLWTLTELVEKNYNFMFDIKLTNWAIHQLDKIKLIAEDLDEERHNYLIKPVLSYLEQLFSNKYDNKTEKIIKEFANKFNKNDKNCFIFANEINIKDDELYRLSKKLIDKTIKEKWIYSNEKKELLKLIQGYIKSVSLDGVIINDMLVYYITNFIKDNNNLSSDKIAELLNTNLISDQDMNITFDKDLLEKHTKIFIDKYNKTIGKKSLEDIIIDFISKDLTLSMTLYKDTHYKQVVHFINTNMRRLDMSTMDTEQYIYYWLQPKWDYTNTKKNIIDIYEGGTSIIDKRTLEYSIQMGELSGELIKSHLPFPHDCEYEKTFWPFAILTKKKYVGNKYEFDSNKYKQDFMGIVLKRRDNSPIVKEICGGIISQLIDHKNPEGAKKFTRECLQNMFDGKYNIKYFLQSRNLKLKESYKDWRRISHVYLAEKITQRDPGNAPQSGDRIEFAVIKVKQPPIGTKLLQGDIIETPQYIKENKLEIDYLFYLTNQIMNPALQFLELVDKKAVNIFNEFIETYSNPKPKKVKNINVEYKKLISEIKTFSRLNFNKNDKLTKFINKNNKLFI